MVGATADRDLHLTLSIHFPEMIVNSPGEMESLVVPVCGEIFGYRMGDEVEDDDTSLPVGRFGLFLVNADEAMETGTSALECFDLHAETEEFMDLFVDPLHHYSFSNPCEGLEEVIGGEGISRILVIDYIEVFPEFRGRNYGLRVLDRLIRQFGVPIVGLVVLKVCPPQFVVDKRTKEAKSWAQDRGFVFPSVSKKKAVQKLKAHYEQIGFREVRGTDFMALHLAFERPPVPNPVHV